MSARLSSDFLVKALIRRVHDAGGSAAVLARGDAMGGGILVLALDRGAAPVFWERGLGPRGDSALIRSGPQDADAAGATDYWQRRRRSDPDLWVIELNVPSGERFAAETIVGD